MDSVVLLVTVENLRSESYHCAMNTRALYDLAQAAYQHAIAELRSSALKIWLIVTRPRYFGRKNISPTSRAFFKALGFYTKIFTLAFALKWLGSRYQFYEGASETRNLILLFVQIAIGFVIIYALVAILGFRSRWLELVQAVLYIDAAYILTLAAISLPLVYLDALIHVPPLPKEVDIFGTEFEVCLTSESWIYWILRGDLQFAIFNDLWKPNDWYRWGIVNRHYFLIVPFLFIFATMLRARVAINSVAVIVVAALAYAVAVESTDFALKGLYRNIADASPCNEKSLATVLQKYSPAMIAKQLEFKLNNSLNAEMSEARPGGWLQLYEKSFVVRGKLRRDDAQDPKWVAVDTENLFRTLYCSDDAHWRAMRSIEYPLIVMIENWNNDVILGKRLDKSICESRG